MKEFNLSEKVIKPIEEWYAEVIYIKDVKEFIKRLKDTFCEEQRTDINIQCGSCEAIDKLAGDKLK